MSQTPSPASNRRRRSLAALVVVGGLATTSVLASAALFTDRDDISANVIETGKVSLSTDAVSGTLSLAGMSPGDSVTKTVTVTNDGPLALRYALSSVVTGDATLAGALRIGVSGPGGESLAADKTLAEKVIGDAATGAQAGDRTLAPNTSEVLTVTVTLPKTSSNDINGQSAAATLTFDAEQTKNNGA